MPLARDDGPITARLNLVPHLTRLPVPEAYVTGSVAAHDDLAVRADVEVNRITGVVVASEPLFPILPEAFGAGVDDNLVVCGLEGDEFAGRVRGRADHAEHVRLRDEFDGDGDPVLPRAQGLVVRGRDEAAGRVTEGERVDWAEVVVVFLDEGAVGGGRGRGVVSGIADARVELDDLLVGHASQKLVPERVLARIEPNHVRRLPRRVAAQTGPCLGVPEFHLPVVGCGEEASAVAVHRDIVDGLGMAVIRPEQFPLVVDVE